MATVWAKAWRGIVVAGLVASATACTRVDNTWLSADTPISNAERCPAAAAGTDWATVPVKTITWTDDGIFPTIVQLHPNTPYVLRLVNARSAGGVAHPRFSAPRFFDNVQLAGVNGMEADGRCIRAVEVTGKATDIRLITGAADASYDFSAFFPMDMAIGGVSVAGRGWPDLEPGLTPGSGVISVR